jgi:hypothetical protein
MTCRGLGKTKVSVTETRREKRSTLEKIESLGLTPPRQTKEEKYKPKGKNLVIGSTKGAEIGKNTYLGKKNKPLRL